MNQVAIVTAPDTKTLRIQPWDRTMVQAVVKAIKNANIGFNPMNNGELIIINIPSLTEERRRNLV